MKNLDYFQSTASHRVADRKRFSYYWNDLTEYINFFCNNSISVLEVGCGTGELIGQIKAQSKTGIDFSEAMIAIAKKQFPDIDFRVMAAESIEIETKYDLIILSNLIGYVDDIQSVFEQLKRISHPRTKIIINFYNRTWQPVLNLFELIGVKRKSPIQNWLTQEDVKNLLELSGYRIYRTHKRMLFPVYIPLLSGILNSFVGRLPIFNSLCINNFVFANMVPCVHDDEVWNDHSVSIIVPARNESGNIENAITRLPKFGREQEIIFVEGNSSDNTWDAIQQVKEKYRNTHNIKCFKQPGKGKNDAVKVGFSEASGDILMILDADLTVPPEELPKFYNALASCKGDFINGSRLVYPMEKKAMMPANIVGNKIFRTIFSWLLEQPFKDTLCGTKVIFRKDYRNLEANRDYFGDFDPFGDYDLIFGAYKLNLKIIELPIHYKERTYGSTNISRFTHGLILLKMCIFAARKIKFR